MRSDVERLCDILESATKIAARVDRGRGRFDMEEDIQLAVVHLLEILGEACAGLSAETRRSYPHVPWRAAADMRNRVIHGYFDIDLDVVWTRRSMGTSNPERVGRGFELLAVGLAPFVDRMISAAAGTAGDWSGPRGWDLPVRAHA